MKSLILFVAFLGLISLAVAEYECTTQSYAAYRQDFGKTEDLKPEVYQAKFDKFCWSIKYVASLNALSPSSTHKINQFSDLLENQNKKILNAQRPLGNGEPMAQIAEVSSNLVGSAPPNWRSKASAIKNQGSCGSCWAFTSTGLYESFMIVKGKSQYDLSEQFVLECTNVLNANNYVSDCTGGYTDFAIEMIKNYGIPLQSTWPYKGTTFGTVAGVPSSPGICNTNQSFIKYNETMGAKDPVTVVRHDNITVAQMETLLADGPVAALMAVDASFQSYSSGVYTLCPAFANAYASINHAVVIVGMDADKNYIIKNSWGTRWGDSGFATVSSVNDCALSAYVFKISWGYQVLGSSLLFLFALLVFFQ